MIHRMFVEMQDIAQHPQEARVQRVLALGEQGVQRRKPVFDPPPVNRRAKGHVAFGIGHRQIIKQAQQMRVVHLVEDDEAGIHRLIPALATKLGPGMTAKAIFGLEQHDRVMVGQKVGGPHAGNPPPR